MRPIRQASEEAGAAFAQTIRETGRSACWVADQAGESETRVRQWISGERHAPLGLLKILPREFRVTLLSILLEEDEPTSVGRALESHALSIGDLAGRIAAHVVQSMADGEWSADELDELARILTRHRGASDRFVADVRAARKATGK